MDNHLDDSSARNPLNAGSAHDAGDSGQAPSAQPKLGRPLIHDDGSDDDDDDCITPAAVRSSVMRRKQRERGALAGVVFCLVVGGVLWLTYYLLWGRGSRHHHKAVEVVAESPSLFLVETLPLENFSLPLTPGALNTHEVLIGLANASTSTLDVSVMYWNLLGDADDDDQATTNPGLGASRGAAMYGAFEAAARRGVTMRFLQDNSTTSLGNIEELEALVRQFPEQVKVGRWDAGLWYGGGIMHMKLWIADERDVYVGSANMDWLSLAQVKEMGVVAFNASQTVARDATALFNTFWSFTTGDGGGGAASLPHPLHGGTKIRPVPDLGAAGLRVPCWEPALGADSRCPNPLFASEPGTTTATWSQPKPVSTAGPSGSSGSGGGTAGGGSTYFLSAAPAAVLGDCGAGVTPGQRELRYTGGALAGCERTWDLNGIVNTIRDSRDSLSLSVMDLLPSSPYFTNTTAPGGVLWWPALFDALTTAAAAGGVRVRVLVSWWAHSDPQMLAYLEALVGTCSAATQAGRAANGSLEVGVFTVPGWDETMAVNGTPPAFPPSLE